MTFNWAIITTILGIVGWLIPFIMLFIVPVNRKPSSATAWLLLAFLLPYLGVLIFLLLGSPKLSRRRREEQHTMDDLISKTVSEARSEPELSALLDPPIPPRYEPFVKLNNNLGHLPAFAGNSVELLPDYNTNLQRITQDIDRAQRFVHVEYYSLSRDEETECVFGAMERAQRRGVQARVLMDQHGSHSYPHYKETRAWLSSVGIECHLMLPLHFFGANYTRPDLRNHRKIVVSGPVVAELEATFLTDWYSETGILLDRLTAPETTIKPVASGDMLCQMLPSGSAFQNENNLKLFTSLIHAARHTLVITNPYFVPDDALTTAITSAAQRGADVTLMNSAVSDQFFVSHAERSYYEELLRAGVKIYQYNAPILLHSKHITVDDDIAVIGSSNLDMRSFQLNLEVTLVCYDPRVVAALRQIEADNLLKSKPVKLGEWETRAASEKLFENISRRTAALQ